MHATLAVVNCRFLNPVKNIHELNDWFYQYKGPFRIKAAWNKKCCVRVIASRVVTVMSRAKTWASLWVPADIFFVERFPSNWPIFQRNRRISRTDLRLLPASSSNHNYKDGNENTEICEHNKYFELEAHTSSGTFFSSFHLSFFAVIARLGCQTWSEWRYVNRFLISNTVFSSEISILKHQFNLLTRVTKRSGSLANKSTWNLTSRSHYRTWSSRPK